MKFEEALKLFRAGKFIRRKCWTPNAYFGTEETPNFGLSPEDLMAEDWEAHYPNSLYKSDASALAEILQRFRDAGIELQERDGERIREFQLVPPRENKYYKQANFSDYDGVWKLR